jgi:hypothetical protein
MDLPEQKYEMQVRERREDEIKKDDDKVNLKSFR